MNILLIDRIVSALVYFTFGMFGIVWLIFANVTQKRISSFLMFNIYQSIFVSICLCIFSYIYNIAANLMMAIPFIKKFVVAFDIFFNRTPLYYTFTLSGFIITILVSYLVIMSLMARKPKLPVISDIVSKNFGG